MSILINLRGNRGSSLNMSCKKRSRKKDKRSNKHGSSATNLSSSATNFSLSPTNLSFLGVVKGDEAWRMEDGEWKM